MQRKNFYLPMHLLLALVTPIPRIPFTTKELTGYTNEAANGANKPPGNLPLFFSFFILCFTVSVTPSINTPKASNDSMILTISFISSFEKIK